MGQLLEALKGVKIPKEAEALVAEADALLTERPKQASYLEYLHAQIKRLAEEKGISEIPFNPQTGTHLDSSSGVHYCTKCIVEGKRAPLRPETVGWYCVTCRTLYKSQEQKEKEKRDREAEQARVDAWNRGEGPDSWMR